MDPALNPFPSLELLRAWMRFGIGLLESLETDVGIDFRRFQVSMTQEFLDTPKIGTIVQKVCGKTVPQLVGTELGVKPGTS